MNKKSKTTFILIAGLLTSIAQAKETITIAVIDSGIHLSHQQLKKSLYKNPGETGIDSLGRDKATNGIDDDGNGYIDDISGWDFVTHKKKVLDINGHGTHISGIILGLTGAESTSDPRIKILPLKYYQRGENGALNLIRSIAALKYAIDMDVDIINYSGGGTSPDPFERRLIYKAARKGILVVSAAGNLGKSLEKQKFFPASYGSENLLAVGALDTRGALMIESNYGSDVDLVALGDKVTSTLPNGAFGPMSGTSQATAIVTRKLASTLLEKPRLKSEKQKLIAALGTFEVKDIAMKTKIPRARSLSPTLVVKKSVAALFPKNVN